MNLKAFRKNLRPDIFFFVLGFLLFPAIIILALLSVFNVKQDMANSTTPIASYPEKQNPVSTPVNTPNFSEPAPPMASSISTVRTGHSEEGLKRSQANQSQIEKTGQWNATQYEKGDIVRKTYVVQQGDTLWQIANAYYGNGQAWIKILENNKDQIGFLPDGEQALIYPGQILILENPSE